MEIIADELGEVNREKPTITRPFHADVRRFLNRQLIGGMKEK
jgi:hypothetical protein